MTSAAPTRSRVDPDVSLRIDALKVVLMFLVVLIHAEKGVSAYMADPPAAVRAATLLFGHTLCRLAVPLFFAISGYLFFRSFILSWGNYRVAMAKRTRSILVPLLLFNALLLVIILVFRKIPYIGDINYIHQRGVVSLLFGFYGHPINYTLWFLRDLYVYFLVSPVFAAMLLEIPTLGLVVMYYLWNFVMQAGIPVELSGAFFFYLGGYFGRRGDIPAPGPRGLALCAGLAALLLGAGLYEEWQGRYSPLYFLSHRAGLVCGVAALWLASASPRIRDSRLLATLAPYAFFIYLAHEPILSYLIYLTRFIHAPAGAVSGVVYYFLLAVLTFGLAYVLGRVLESRAPRAYALATGSRRRMDRTCA